MVKKRVDDHLMGNIADGLKKHFDSLGHQSLDESMTSSIYKPSPHTKKSKKRHNNPTMIDDDTVSITPSELHRLMGLDMLANPIKKRAETDKDTVISDVTGVPSRSEYFPDNGIIGNPDVSASIDDRLQSKLDRDRVREKDTHKIAAVSPTHHRHGASVISEDDDSASSSSYTTGTYTTTNYDSDDSTDSFRDKLKEKLKMDRRHQRHHRDDSDNASVISSVSSSGSIRSDAFRNKYLARTEGLLDADAEAKRVDDRKRDLLARLSVLKRKGVKINPNLAMTNELGELEEELALVAHRLKLRRAIKVQRGGIMYFAKAAEFLTGLVSPIDFVLEGWGDIMEEELECGDYDDLFIELYENHKDKIPVGPEATLAMMIGMSAISIASANVGSRGMKYLAKMTSMKEPDVDTKKRRAAPAAEMDGPTLDIEKMMAGLNGHRIQDME